MRRLILISILLGVAALFFSVSHASATTLYGTAYIGSSGEATLYTIDPNTGIATPVGLTGFDRVGAIDFDPITGTLYGIGIPSGDTGTAHLITIDITTGVATAVGATGTAGTFQDISFRSDGTLFGYSGGVGTPSIYTFDLSTGAATLVGPTNEPFVAGHALAFDPSDALYNIRGFGTASSIDLINQSTGDATTVGTLDYPTELLDPRTNAMDYDLTSGVLYGSVVHGGFQGSQSNFLATIDLATGNVDVVGATIRGLDGLAVLQDQQNGVPEAMSMLWLALPLCGMFVFRRYRRA